jgi:hypothetical protein
VHHLLNQFSFALSGALLAVLAGLIAGARSRRLGLLVGGGTAAVLLSGFLVLRTGAGDVQSGADLQSALGGGRPVAIELYSDY